MRVTVRLFARLRDLAGTAELVRDVPTPATVQTVWSTLVAEMPALMAYERTMSVAVNAEYARMAAPVHVAYRETAVNPSMEAAVPTSCRRRFRGRPRAPGPPNDAQVGRPALRDARAGALASLSHYRISL